MIGKYIYILRREVWNTLMNDGWMDGWGKVGWRFADVYRGFDRLGGIHWGGGVEGTCFTQLSLTPVRDEEKGEEEEEE